MSKPEILLVGLHHNYQWLQGFQPSVLERQQRQRFTERIDALVREFQPNVIADETPDTDNAELLAVLPTRPIPIDITYARKRERGFNVERSCYFPCPYVDSIRERYWRLRLHHLVRPPATARVLMFVGAMHLEASYIKPLAFPELLTAAGYRVRVENLYRENGWDHSWMEGWSHPVTEVTGKWELKCCVRLGNYQRDGLRCEHRTDWKMRFEDKE